MRTILNDSAAAQTEADLPIYPGIDLADIVLVRDEATAARASAELMAAGAVGFDTESKPTFRKGEVSTGPHLVQLATEHKAYLFPVPLAETLPALKALLESTTLLKIGMGLGNDRFALQSRLGVELHNTLDLGEAMRGKWHRGTVGAKLAVTRYFGQKFLKSKKVGTSNWASSRLSERQLRYAADDAQVALRLYRAWLSDPARARDTVQAVSAQQKVPQNV